MSVDPALGAWAKAQEKTLKGLAQRRDADGAMADRALELVRRFIVARGLILFGGLAIDYALRLRGASIYQDERPDFDCLSPRAAEDAYDLADELQRAGFANVEAIRGIHVQTMKVRTDFVWVADLGHAPEEVYARVPTLLYQGMRIVHPDYQRMDMHLSFCFPFSGAPREDVFHRWRKDLARFNLLAEHYPLPAPPAPPGLPAPPGPPAPGRPPAGATRTATARSGLPVVGQPRDLQVALVGFAAYAALRGALDAARVALGAVPGKVSPGDPPRLALAFPDPHTVAVEVPAEVPDGVCLASPAPGTVAPPGARRREPYMDAQPESFEAPPQGGPEAPAGLAVLSTRGRLLAVTPVRVPTAMGAMGAPPPGQAGGAGGAGAPPSDHLLVATPQHLLLYFLHRAHRADGREREVYLEYYGHTLALLGEAEAAYAQAGADAALFAQSPFAPAVGTLGGANRTTAYVVATALTARQLGKEAPEACGLSEEDTRGVLEGLPANYRPGRARPAVAYGALFRRAGRLV